MGVLWAVVAAALAAPVDVESERAQMRAQAERSLWAGVDASYTRLVAEVADALTLEDHLLGFEAARGLGQTKAALERLDLAIALGADAGIQAEAERIRQRFAPVVVRGSWRRPPRLVADRVPLDPDARESVEHARQRVAADGAFDGWLPTGGYVVGDQRFTLTAGQPVVVIDARRPTGELALDEAAAKGASFEAAHRGPMWSGPVISAGPAAIFAPSAAPVGADTVAPEPTFAAAATVRAGAEIGVAKSFALAPVVDWTGGFARQHQAHACDLALGLVLRSERVRGVVEGGYGVVYQRGLGVQSTFDRSEDGDPRTDAGLGYTGSVWGPVARAAVGGRLVELGRLDLMLEGWAGAQIGAFNYVSGGLRLGVVPAGAP